MKTSIELDEQFDEIVFQNRNKNYGAYFLRKAYKNHLSKALLITVSISMIVCSLPLLAHYFKDDKIPEILSASYEYELSDINKAAEEKTKLPSVPKIKNPENAIVYRTFQPTHDTIMDYKNFISDELNKKTIVSYIDTTSGQDTTSTFNPIVIDIIPDITIPTIVEEMPIFPGGESELMKFFKKNFLYPEPERDLGVMGIVVVSFVVETDGSITSIGIYKGETANLNAEAIRLISIMPKWKPGKQNGAEVRVAINLPVRFTLL